MHETANSNTEVKEQKKKKKTSKRILKMRNTVWEKLHYAGKKMKKKNISQQDKQRCGHL